MLRGIAALLGTTILWASSFPVIKIAVGSSTGLGYTWMRSAIAALALLPLAARRIGRAGRATALGGVVTGIAYALGLWLQGWGTGLTTASNSAFITGLNVVFVHIYVAARLRRYSAELGAELALAILGLYLLTSPRGGFGLGDALVLAGSVAWAAQVLLVSRYGRGDPIVFTFFEMLPAITFAVPDAMEGGIEVPAPSTALGLVYLGLACSDGAFALQAYGQRFVEPEIAAMIYLLEPVLASLFSWAVLGEHMTPIQVAGAAAIVIATAMASRYAIQQS